MKIKFMGVELEPKYDLTDADDTEKLEAIIEDYLQKITDIETGTGVKQSQLIRKQIEAAEDMLDKVFGKGSAAKVFEGRKNLKTACAVTYFIQGITRIYVPKVLEQSLKEDIAKYSPKRAQRL